MFEKQIYHLYGSSYLNYGSYFKCVLKIINWTHFYEISKNVECMIYFTVFIQMFDLVRYLELHKMNFSNFQIEDNSDRNLYYICMLNETSDYFYWQKMFKEKHYLLMMKSCTHFTLCNRVKFYYINFKNKK